MFSMSGVNNSGFIQFSIAPVKADPQTYADCPAT